jgi:hypothetical protein
MVNPGVVILPLTAIEVVPVPPTASVFAEKSVDVAPPKKRNSVLVEFPVPANEYPTPWMVSALPPTNAPGVPVKVIPVPAVTDDVAAEYVEPVTPAP